MTPVAVVGIIAAVVIGGGLLLAFMNGDEQGVVDDQSDIEEVADDNDVLEDVRELSIRSENMSFSPSTIRAEPGERVEITFANTGVHTFTIDELNIDERLEDETETVEFTVPDRDATYTFYCNIPGHREQGMEGTLIVGTGGSDAEREIELPEADADGK